MRKLVYIFVLFLLFSCGNSEKIDFARLVSEWQGRKVIFPEDTSFVSYSRTRGEQKMHFMKGKYTIFSYIDSTGCMSCKLRLPEWSDFIHIVDSISYGTVSFVFVFQTNKKDDLVYSLKKNKFNYPVFIDENSSFDSWNKLPSDMLLQTFLLNGNNEVVAIGNPIHNSKVKELYMNIIQGKTVTKEENTILTKVQVKEHVISLGRFNWQEEQKMQFKIYNVGKRPLVINDVTTSCGCTSVDYPKQPVRPGDSISLQVTYKAEHLEHFDKTITVYCNTEPSLIQLKITGDAE